MTMDNLLLTSLTVNIVSFSAGTTLSWPSPMVVILGRNGTNNPLDSPITPEQDSWISALLYLGAAIGPFIFGFLTNKTGQKYSLLLTGVPLLVGYALIAFTKSVMVIYIARFLSGLSLGATSNLVTVYTGEIASSYNRGALSSLFSLFLCAGMLFCYCIGPYVSVMLFNVMLAVFPLIFMIFFLIIGSESPYFYIARGKVGRARETLQKLRGPLINVEDELMDIYEHVKEAGNSTCLEMFKTEALRNAFIIALGLMLFEQFSGTIPIFNYTETIFQFAEVDVDPAICSIIVGAVQFVTSIVIPIIVDKLGRKMLLQVSYVGMVLATGPLGYYCYMKDNHYDVSYLKSVPVICLMVYTFSYNFGSGPLPWIMLGELFPSNVKSSATLIVSSFCWGLAFLVVKFFQPISTSLGMGVVFWMFTISCLIAVPFNQLVVIETKGKSLQQIEKELS